MSHALRRLALAGLLVSATALPALAQFAPPMPPQGGEPLGGPGEDYRQGQAERRLRDFDRPRYAQPGYGQAYGGGRRFGRQCSTNRGSCIEDEPQPMGSSCGCYIDPYGLKRGAIVR